MLANWYQTEILLDLGTVPNTTDFVQIRNGKIFNSSPEKSDVDLKRRILLSKRKPKKNIINEDVLLDNDT